MTILDVSHTDLHLHPGNARRAYTGIDGLAASIETQGVQEPLVVVARAAGGYTVVDGNRRLQALRALGETAPPAPCRLVALSPTEQLLYMATSFLQRCDVDIISEGRHYRRILDIDPGLTQTALARRLGVSMARIAHRLTLLELDADIQALIAEGKLHKSLDLAKALLSIPDEWRAERIALAQKLASSDITVRSGIHAVNRLKGRLVKRAQTAASVPPATPPPPTPATSRRPRLPRPPASACVQNPPPRTGGHGAAVSMALHEHAAPPAPDASFAGGVFRDLARTTCRTCDQYARTHTMEPAWSLAAHAADEVCEDCGLHTLRGACRACALPRFIRRIALYTKEPGL